MDNLKVYSLNQREQWENVVRTFADYDVYYLPGYCRAFQLHGDGEPLLFYYEGDSVRGINVVMKRDIANDPLFCEKLSKDTLFDFATPYGYGGWLIEGNGDHDLLFTAYGNWCKEHNVVSEFVRYHPLLHNGEDHADGYDRVMLSNTIAMDLSSPAMIWSGLTSKNRNMVRKAQKNDVRIYNGHYPEIFKQFRDIYNATMDRDSATEYYYFGDKFYQSILNDLPNESQVFFAELNGEIIAASIILASNGKMSYHLSGSRIEYRHLAPTNLLLYQAALWGYSNGYKSLHLGGGVGSTEDSLFDFKHSFYRGEPKQFYIGKRIFNQKVYDELMAMRQAKEDSAFFPGYRAR